MEIVQPDWELLTDPEEIMRYPEELELFGRVCYKSEGRITPGSAEKFIKMLMKRGHESVLEHKSITVRFIGDRAFSHQLVRHRLAAYSQESQRFCNYAEGGNVGEMKFILPPSIAEKPVIAERWKDHLKTVEAFYNEMVNHGVPGEDARSILPNAAKTEVVTTYNIRVWRHVFDMRVDSHAQWQIRNLMTSILDTFHRLAPCLFADKIEKFGIRPTTLETEEQKENFIKALSASMRRTKEAADKQARS